jgi:hypothetical protein
MATAPALDPMPRPVFTKARDNDRRAWTEQEDAAIIDIFSLGICAGQTSYIFPERLPGRRYGDILERRDALKEAGRLRVPAAL